MAPDRGSLGQLEDDLDKMLEEHPEEEEDTSDEEDDEDEEDE